MSLGRVLGEEFRPEVLKWLGERADIVVVNPWMAPERWTVEACRVDAVISRKGKITREHMKEPAAGSRSSLAPASASIRRVWIWKRPKNSKS